MPSLGLALLAGLAASLSPCVLPVIPLVAGSALQRSRMAPLLLALGQILAFSLTGLAVAAFGDLGGISPSHLRTGAGVVMVMAGTMLFFPALAEHAGAWMRPITEASHRLAIRAEAWGPLGYFLAGALLGIAWSPCTGPVLGGVIALTATQGPSLHALAVMVVFGAGATAPLLIAAYGARYFAARRGAMVQLGTLSRAVLGIGLVVVGMLIALGLDRAVEAWLLNIMPENWSDFVSRF